MRIVSLINFAYNLPRVFQSKETLCQIELIFINVNYYAYLHMCVFFCLVKTIWEFNNSIGFFGMRVLKSGLMNIVENICKDMGRWFMQERAFCVRVSRVYWIGIHRKVPLRSFCGREWNMIPRVTPVAFAGASTKVQRRCGEDTSETSRPFLSSPVAIFATLSSRGQADSFGYIVPNIKSFVRLTGPRQARYNTPWKSMHAAANSSRVKFHYVLTPLQTRGDCARRSISMPGSTMNSATRTAPLSLINLITLSQFPRRRCDRPDCRRAIQSCRFSSRLPPPRPAASGYEIHATVMTRRKYRWAWITTYPLMPFRLSV